MKNKLIFVFFLFGLLVIPNVLALNDAKIDINITYFANYNANNGTGTPDMTNNIYVGNDVNPWGEGFLELNLTKNGSAIIDYTEDYENPNDDVPGLQILRGENEKGMFIQFDAAGFIDEKDREELKFNISFKNSIVSEIEQVRQGYELPNDGICGIIEGSPGKGVANDEWEINVGDKKGGFCTITGPGADRVRVYYTLQDGTAPEIMNIVTNPNLPHENRMEKENISISFDSDEYPIFVDLNLFKGEDLIESQGTFELNDGGISLNFVIPANLEPEEYELRMFVRDSENNSLVVVVGNIKVINPNYLGESERNNHDYDDNKAYFDENFISDFNFPVENNLKINEPSKILLNQKENNEVKIKNNLSVVIVSFIILNIILLILVILIGIIRK